jgi:hypothetical protein
VSGEDNVRHDESGVAVARWSCTADADGVAPIAGSVAGFAGRHGMSAGCRGDVGAAVGAVVAHAASGALPRRHDVGRVTVDAATDGAWLSVRVVGEQRDGATLAGSELARPLVDALSDRLEWTDGGSRSGLNVVMEFPMTRTRTVSAGPRHRAVSWPPRRTAKQRAETRWTRDPES